MPERWRTVRVRLTISAVVVAALVVLLAGLWLVHTVDGSLRDRQRDQDVQRLAELRAELEQGQRPGELEVVVPGRTTFFEVRVNQRRVAATPGYAELPEDQVLLTTSRVDTPTGLVELVAASPLEPIERSVDAVRSGLLLALPLLVVGAGILTWALAGRALRPVESIRTEVESISGTTLDRRVPVPDSGDEIARLAQTMNAMLDRLQEAAARQQRFVADASHELRSPVAAIRTELEVAQRTATPEEWPAVADRLLAEEARLEAVITDLLLLATLDEGAPLPDPVAVDLADEAREEARRRAPDAGAVVVEVDAPAPAMVLGNRTQLRRALANLLDNAGRHARSTVRLSVRARDGRVRVLVDDDGPGIPEADRERVFERFVRLDEHRGAVGSAAPASGCRWSSGSPTATTARRASRPRPSAGLASCSTFPPPADPRSVADRR